MQLSKNNSGLRRKLLSCTLVSLILTCNVCLYKLQLAAQTAKKLQLKRKAGFKQTKLLEKSAIHQWEVCCFYGRSSYVNLIKHYKVKKLNVHGWIINNKIYNMHMQNRIWIMKNEFLFNADLTCSILMAFLSWRCRQDESLLQSGGSRKLCCRSLLLKSKMDSDSFVLPVMWVCFCIW